jgi:hypothetical protein
MTKKDNHFKSPKDYDLYMESLLAAGNFKQYMYEVTNRVKTLYHGSNKLTEVISQKQVWLIICRMQNKIDELELRINNLRQDEGCTKKTKIQAIIMPVPKTIQRKPSDLT